MKISFQSKQNFHFLTFNQNSPRKQELSGASKQRPLLQVKFRCFASIIYHNLKTQEATPFFQKIKRFLSIGSFYKSKQEISRKISPNVSFNQSYRRFSHLYLKQGKFRRFCAYKASKSVSPRVSDPKRFNIRQIASREQCQEVKASNRQQVTSYKQRATSDKQQTTGNK